VDDLTPGPSPGRRGEMRANEFDFAAKRFNVSRDEGFSPGVSVEVTIGTAVLAKGNVEV
jgi:hypothetical protein